MLAVTQRKKRRGAELSNVMNASFPLACTTSCFRITSSFSLALQTAGFSGNRLETPTKAYELLHTGYSCKRSALLIMAQGYITLRKFLWGISLFVGLLGVPLLSSVLICHAIERELSLALLYVCVYVLHRVVQ